MDSRMMLFATSLLFVFGTCSTKAKDQHEYPVSLEILAVEHVVVGSRTEVTPRKCEDKFNHVMGKAYTECTGGDSRAIEEKETRVRSKLIDHDAKVVEIICSANNVFQDCLDLQVGSRYQARWKAQNLLAVAYQNRKGNTKEVMYEVRPTMSEQRQSIVGESLCKLSSIPDHANVAVDGEFVGQTPADLKLTAGKHKIEMSADGYRPFVQSLTGMAGSTVTLNITLEKQ